jgi:signal transduction histidine kinase/ActR/RegA family two-component response regulator
MVNMARLRRDNEEALREARDELRSRAAELARFNRVAVGRELRLIELKKEVNEILEQAGQQVRYSLEFEERPRRAVPRPAEFRSAAPLESILLTDQLHQRPSRASDYKAENDALVSLTQSLADSPQAILQKLVDKVLEITGAGSAGLSMLTEDGERFEWVAIAGRWSPHLGGGTPRDFGPCGDVLDRNAPMLFTRWERRYPYLAEATPLAEEGLLVPFRIDDRPAGTIWAINHDSDDRFDAEDLRLLESMGRFAAAAYQAHKSSTVSEQHRAALNLLEDAVQSRRLVEDANQRLREEVAQRLRVEASLRESDRLKNEFLALLGHELRNPLAPIYHSSEILTRTLADNPQARAGAAVIQRQTRLLTRMVDDLLDVARISQGNISLRREIIDLSGVVAQGVETVDPLLIEKRHQLSIEFCFRPLYVSGDADRLAQCVSNLVSNAAKYTDPEGRIRIEVRAEGSFAVVEVADNGCGIPDTLLPRIFELFVQGDQTLDRAQGGLGIGLPVVKKLVEMHGGSVSARSRGPGEGASFEMRLPQVAPATATLPKGARNKVPPRRVFIVDDNADAAESLAALLQLDGHEVQTATSSRDALERMESFKPDVALLDIGLPQMNGYDLQRRLREIPALQAVRFIAVTGYGRPEDRGRIRQAGFEDHLIKPVSIPALNRALLARRDFPDRSE